MKIIKVKDIQGKAYGHVPGHYYHDVEVVIRRSALGAWEVRVKEVWGSAQGMDDEEHGNRMVSACGNELERAVRLARARAIAAGMERDYAIQALSCAEADAFRAAEEDENKAPLASLSTAELEAELARRETTKET